MTALKFVKYNEKIKKNDYWLLIGYNNNVIKMLRRLKKFKKKSQKGFTLIELLVVVAIIGVLAAVGVTAYSGFTASAKEKAAKSIHANVVKKIVAELKKCELGEQYFMTGTRYDNGSNYQQTCVTNGNERTAAQRARDGIFYTSSDLNPWTPTQQAVNRASNWQAGRVSVWFEGNANDARIMIRSCYKNPCSGTNRKQERINID